MSVEYEAKLTVGWRVKQDDIPDYDERCDEEWDELRGLWKETCKLLGKHIYVEDLCAVEDSWCGDTQMIGVPMFDKELPMDELVDKTKALGELAERVYRQVMRKKPEDGPYLISWTQVS